MTKTIQLTLTQIKYGGDSIEDDIRLEIEVVGKFLRVDQQIKPGAASIINREIGKFETDQKLFRANVFITIIERDLLFNDTNNTQGSIKVDTTTDKPQKFTFVTQVREKRSRYKKFWGKRAAIFEIILIANVLDMTAYIPDLDESQGFLKIRFEDNISKEKFLPAYLKVRAKHRDASREYFTILEGPERGRSASLGRKNDGSSWLISNVQYRPIARAQYSISKKTFILNGKKYQVADDPEMPWQKGLYDIEIPDYPHGGGHRYMNQAKRAMTWFKIGHSGSRYLHVGLRSAGCMTITETTRWMEIYNVLIKARKGDFMSVGVLEIIN